MFSIFNKLKLSYQKNFPEIIALQKKNYPEFILERNPITLRDEIPVFTFHAVNPVRFEEQLQFLHLNNYQTLSGDELYESITGLKPIPERGIVLTFDDGWRNLYSVAYPLLKKYKMKAICFLISGLITSDTSYKENILGERGIDSEILCRWKEVKEMHEDGTIDFQSHSMYHNRIFIADKVEDFFYPNYNSFAYNLNIPVTHSNDIENISRELKLGTPIYKHASKFSGRRRYFDDQELRKKCIDFVELNGGKNFFRDIKWRKKLFKIVQSYKTNSENRSHFENEEKYRDSLFFDFLESKRIIESKLPGKKVNHFCYPWWEGSEAAVEASKKAGYLTNFWGVIPNKRTNKQGTNPFKISRILTDEFIFRLPGKDRKTILTIYREKFSANYNRFKKNLIQSDINIL